MDEGPEAQAARRPERALRWRSRWGLHLLVVTLLTVGDVAIVMSTSPEAGFNFASVFTALPLLILGLPWTLWNVVDPYAVEDYLYGRLDHSTAYWGLWALSVGPAFLNVAIHAAVVMTRRHAGHARRVHPPSP